MIYNIGARNDEINNLRKQLAAKPTTVTEVREITKTVCNGPWVVCFAQNSEKLDTKAKNTLNNVVENVDKNAEVTVKAMASPEGKKEYNIALSQKRANNVADYLKTRGVKVKSAIGVGVDGNTSNRLAIVRVYK